MQKEITQKQVLLDTLGNIANPGFAKTMLWDYNRENIKMPKALIKEWDYYLINNGKYALALTIADMGYLGALSASIVDFENVTQITKSSVCLFPMGKVNMPKTSLEGDASFTNAGVSFSFKNDGKTRHLIGKYARFGNKGETLTFDIVLKNEPKESMVIATPFNESKRFYYNQKINCIEAEGMFSLGDSMYPFENKNGSLGTLDWGRGCWTYDNTWYWGSLQTVLNDGSSFGFNIGYGFGNTENASENMLFYKGMAHKLEDVAFNIAQKNGKDDFMSTWTFTSSDGRFEMIFEPLIDRYAPFNLGFFCMIPHQVFGNFSGKAILDDGTQIELNRVLGFAEKVHNKW